MRSTAAPELTTFGGMCMAPYQLSIVHHQHIRAGRAENLRMKYQKAEVVDTFDR